MSRFACLLVCLLLAPPALADDPEPPKSDDAPKDWAQWRGPERDGSFDGPAWPEKLQGRLKQLWRVELGHSYASPVITKDRVYTVETKDRKQEVVRALDRATGKQLWEATWEGAMRVPFFAAKNGSWIRSSPAFDGEALYVAGIRDVLVCLEAKTGEVRWRVDFPARFKTPLPSFGCVCSPLVHEGSVYMQAGGSVVKLSCKDGATQWRSMVDGGGMYGSAFSSPVIRTLAGKQQLVVQSRTELGGIDLESGQLLWKEKIFASRGMNILTPSIHDDGVLTSAYGGRTQVLKISATEGKLSAKRVWQNRLQGYMSSPVLIDGHAYIHLRNRKLACVDLAQGNVNWDTERRFGQYWSMLKQGQRILALDEQGILFLVKANPRAFELIDEQRVSKASTWAHLSMSGKHLAVRELKALSFYVWE